MRCTLSFDEHSMAVVRLPSCQTRWGPGASQFHSTHCLPTSAQYEESHTSIVEQTCRHGITLSVPLRTQSHMFCSTQARFPYCCW
jgi:hypothetical protein